MADEVMCPILSLLGAEKVCKKELCAWYVDAELSEGGNSGCAIIMAAFALDTMAHEESDDEEDEEVDEGDGDEDSESSNGDHHLYEDHGTHNHDPFDDQVNALTQEEIDAMLKKADIEEPEYESNNDGTAFPTIQKPLILKKTEEPKKVAFLHGTKSAGAAELAKSDKMETTKSPKPLTAQQITEKSKHIVKAVSKAFKFRRALILSTVKSDELFRARYAIAYFTRKLLDFSDEAIEKLLNLKEGGGIEYFRNGVKLLNSETHGKRMESIEWQIKNN